MTINELDKRLRESLMQYSEEMRASFEESDRTPATKDDLNNLARQSFYLMEDFRKNIIDYLKNNK